MMVRIEYSVAIDDSLRQAIRRFYGQSGMATRREVKAWYQKFGLSMDDDLAVLADQIEAQ